MRRLMRRSLLAAAALGLTVGAVGQAEADILASHMSMSGNTTAAFTVPGQSVTTVAGGPFDNITFNFYGLSSSPAAQGDLFILTLQYQDAPSGLSSSTPGFLAESTGVSGGVYQFAPTVNLNGATQYFFYADQAFNNGITFAGTYTGGQGYQASSTTSDFAPLPADGSWNFLLEGTPVATVPEPSTAVIAALGTVAFLAYAWSRHCRAQRRPGAA